jgi:hypothetical protein
VQVAGISSRPWGMPPKGGRYAPVKRKERSSKRPGMSSIKIEVYITGSSRTIPTALTSINSGAKRYHPADNPKCPTMRPFCIIMRLLCVESASARRSIGDSGSVR